MKKNIFKLASISLLFALTLGPITANEQTNDSNAGTYNYTPTAEEVLKSTQEGTTYGTVVFPDNVRNTLGDYTLYPVFKDKEASFNSFKKDMKDQLEIVKTTFDLAELTMENYQIYYDSTRNIVEEGTISYDDSAKMLSFFATFDNYRLNDEVANALDEAKVSNDMSSKVKVDEIAPQYNKSLTNEVKSSNSSTRSLSLPNLASAINYAGKYAISPNTSYAYYGGTGDGGDCTNFVSQILQAGGISQVKTGNETTGWWYTSRNNRSISWVRADTFSRYMGRTYYGYWSTMVSKLHAGAFIASDFNGDYYIDHMAFVTKKISNTNVLIAQHSDNYHKESEDSNWKIAKNTWMVR